MKVASFLLIGLIALESCTTMDKALLVDASIRKPLDALELRIGSDVGMARIDLNRSSHQETRTSLSFVGNQQVQMSQTVQVPDPYHPIVIDLGGGLILDYNKNLCIDFVRYFGLENEKKYTITIAHEVGEKPIVQTSRDGDSFRIDSAGLFGKITDRWRLNGNELVGQDGSARLRVEGGTASYETKGMLGTGSSAEIRMEGPDMVVIPHFWKDSVVLRSAPDKVFIEDRNLTVEHKGNAIDFVFRGFLGNTYTQTLIRTETSLFFFSPDFRGCELRKEGDAVRYLINGSSVYVVAFTKG